MNVSIKTLFILIFSYLSVSTLLATNLEKIYPEWFEVIKSDPKLQGIKTEKELHIRLKALSDEIRESGQDNNTIFEQMTFSGKTACPLFKPHMGDPRRGLLSLGTKISDYYRYAIKDPLHVKAAIDLVAKDKPSVIIAGQEGGSGALLLGGYKSILKPKFLKKHNIGLVINTASNLEAMFLNYKKAKVKREAKGLKFIDMDWQDRPDYKISDKDIIKTLQLINDTRKSGAGVLVHCAQGKSRSGTAVVAYIAATGPDKTTLKNNVGNALKAVQNIRKSVEPNPGFREQLLDWQKRGILLKALGRK